MAPETCELMSLGLPGEVRGGTFCDTVFNCRFWKPAIIRVFFGLLAQSKLNHNSRCAPRYPVKAGDRKVSLAP